MSENYNNKYISIRGAKVHNLKEIDVDIPRNRLTVISGVSGSGKSSLAFDTLYAEGQRRFVESLSSYARQFLERMAKPDCESISGIPPAIAIQQNTFTRNPRSTVGTTTEIYDFIRILFGRIGTTICYSCGEPIRRDNTASILKEIEKFKENEKIYITFTPETKEYNAETFLESLNELGFYRVVDKNTLEVVDLSEIYDRVKHTFEDYYILSDRTVVQKDTESMNRIADSLDTALRFSNGNIQIIKISNKQVYKYSNNYECASCEIKYEEPEPKLFSFNNPQGACPKCQGFGRTVGLDEDLIIPDKSKSLRKNAISPFKSENGSVYQRDLMRFCMIKHIDPDVPFYELDAKSVQAIWDGDKKTGYEGINGYFEMVEEKSYKMNYRVILSRYRGYTKCRSCNGSRLRTSARQVYVGGKNIPELIELSLSELLIYFKNIELSKYHFEVAEQLLSEIVWRLGLLVDIGLDYLNLSRLSHTLSGGESQRINLSTALGSSLVGTLYVLDEPSIGLHTRDTNRLLNILYKLRNLGNTVVVVEHDPDIIKNADYIVDIGPQAGSKGGEVVFAGTINELPNSQKSITAQYITAKKKIKIPSKRRKISKKEIIINKASEHNLKINQVRIPLEMIVCITGVSGSGKSTLINDILYSGLKKMQGSFQGMVGSYESISGYSNFKHIEIVDQSKIGTSSRSTPVTYSKTFDMIRELFASTQAAKQLGLKPGYFSFNVTGGRCDECDGEGNINIDMQFLPDVSLVCEACKGTRYKREATNILFNGKSIVDVLEMTIDEAVEFFSEYPRVQNKLKIYSEVGLGYLKLGQPSSMLSGGESQRIKLAGHLDINNDDETLFIFDEPTTGLHLDDISKLISCINKLVEYGHSVLIIEHNLAIISISDYIIDLGPEGGNEGGKIVGQGTPEEISKLDTHTGKALKDYFRQYK